MRVFGIDIIKGSVRSKSRRPVYALVRMEEGEIIAEGEVSGFRLFRILNEERPDILAVDSLQEIAADQHDLYAFLQALPPSVRLVQVTGGERKESLGKVASRFNISFNRFDPFEEARTIARVAGLGAGAEVIAFENTSEIIVSRHRSPGKGGWSQNRYVRKIHGAVQHKAREIEMALVAAGLRYQKKETRAFGGNSRVAFEVYASRGQVPATTYRGADVQVRISGKRLERITFRPLSGKPRYLIVGIDPGTTTAVAALDLDGNILSLASSRQMAMSDVIEAIYRVGKPLVIASDVHEMPFSVEKIRRAFSGIAFSPRQDMSVETKQELTAPFQYQNDHERDALAAAMEAFRSYKNKFQNLLRRVPPGNDLDEVKAGIVRGLSLEQVLSEMKGKPVRPVAEAPKVEIDARRDERIRILDGTVKRLKVLVKDLQEELQKKDHEIIRLQGRVKRIRSQQDQVFRRDAELVKRDAVIASLKKRVRREERNSEKLLKRMKKIRAHEETGTGEQDVMLKRLPSLTREGIRALSEELGIREGDHIYVSRVEVWGKNAARDLAGSGIGGLVAKLPQGARFDPQLEAIFREASVPLLSAESAGAVMRGGSVTAERDRLDTAIRIWEEEQRAFEREKKAELLDEIYREYRTERGKEMKKVG
jgi:predicted RNase H-like nuclease (RuvC/YqgF family)